MDKQTQSYILTVFVKPRSKKKSVEWIDADTIKMHIRAVPEKGKANEAVIHLLSTVLEIKKSSILLLRGFSTSMKQFKILGSHPHHLQTKDYIE